MCSKYKEEFLTIDESSLKEHIETLTKEMFPSTNEVEMLESGVTGNKRGSLDDNDNESNTHKKPALDAAILRHIPFYITTFNVVVRSPSRASRNTFSGKIGIPA